MGTRQRQVNFLRRRAGPFTRSVCVRVSMGVLIIGTGITYCLAALGGIVRSIRQLWGD